MINDYEITWLVFSGIVVVRLKEPQRLSHFSFMTVIILSWLYVCATNNILRWMKLVSFWNSSSFISVYLRIIIYFIIVIIILYLFIYSLYIKTWEPKKKSDKSIVTIKKHCIVSTASISGHCVSPMRLRLPRSFSSKTAEETM